MRITEEQKRILDSLVVERLRENKEENALEFCANENGRDAWRQLGINRKMGECVFWHCIVPKLMKV